MTAIMLFSIFFCFLRYFLDSYLLVTNFVEEYSFTLSYL